MSNRNDGVSSKRKRVADKELDLCATQCSSSNKNIEKNVKKQKVSESVEKHDDHERSAEKFDFLREALKKLHQLESEIAAIEEETVDNDRVDNESIDCEGFEENALAFEAEAIGFAVCARETLNYLASQGLTQDSPLVKSLRDRLIGKCQEKISLPRM